MDNNDKLFVYYFMSYHNALMWNAFEIAFWVGIILFTLILLGLPTELAMLGELFGFLMLIGVWSRVIRALADPKCYGKNCWYDPKTMD